VRTDVMQRMIAYPTDFPSHFTFVFSREYGMWKYRACTLELNLLLNANRATVRCYPAARAPVTAGRDLTVEEAGRVRRLAGRADLYGADHIGVDITPTDGTFDTIRFRPVAGGRAVVLITLATEASPASGPGATCWNCSMASSRNWSPRLYDDPAPLCCRRPASRSRHARS
jgi:hypothetical protein